MKFPVWPHLLACPSPSQSRWHSELILDAFLFPPWTSLSLPLHASSLSDSSCTFNSMFLYGLWAIKNKNTHRQLFTLPLEWQQFIGVCVLCGLRQTEWRGAAREGRRVLKYVKELTTNVIFFGVLQHRYHNSRFDSHSSSGNSVGGLLKNPACCVKGLLFRDESSLIGSQIIWEQMSLMSAAEFSTAGRWHCTNRWWKK